MRRAQQDPTRRLRTATAALGLGIAALLTATACGSGQIAQTSGMPPAVNGGLAQAGPIAVRNVEVAFPASGRTYAVGSDVPLVVTIVNSGDTPDSLVSVTSTASKPAELTGSLDLPPGAAVVAGADLVDRPSSSATAEATTTTSAAPTTTTGESSTATTTETPAAQPKVGQVSIVLKQVNTTVQPGQSITVTFTFAHAGAVTLSVPVASPGGSPAE